MNNLQVNMLINFNIFNFKNIMINYIEKKLRIFNYHEILALINCTLIDRRKNKVI